MIDELRRACHRHDWDTAIGLFSLSSVQEMVDVGHDDNTAAHCAPGMHSGPLELFLCMRDAARRDPL